MKPITIISTLVLISLLVTSIVNHQERAQRDQATQTKILKANSELHHQIIELETMLQECSASKDTILHSGGYYARIAATQPEIGTPEWYPTHIEWITLTPEEKTIWEANYLHF